MILLERLMFTKVLCGIYFYIILFSHVYILKLTLRSVYKLIRVLSYHYEELISIVFKVHRKAKINATHPLPPPVSLSTR